MNNFMSTLDEINDWMNAKTAELISNINSRDREIRAAYDAYWKSDDYESDLDSLMASFECKSFKAMSFDQLSDRTERVKAKEAALNRKLMLYIAEGGKKGFALSFSLKNPSMILKGTLGMAGVHASHVGVKAAQILIRRVLLKQ